MESKTPTHLWQPPPPRDQPVTFIHSSTTDQKLKQMREYNDKHNEREARRRDKKKAAAKAASQAASSSASETNVAFAEKSKETKQSESEIATEKCQVIVCARCKGYCWLPHDVALDDYEDTCEICADKY